MVYPLSSIVCRQPRQEEKGKKKVNDFHASVLIVTQWLSMDNNSVMHLSAP